MHKKNNERVMELMEEFAQKIESAENNSYDNKKIQEFTDSEVLGIV